MQQFLLIVIAVLLFGFIVFFHEFGHFFMAKLSKIRVNESSIGMGPKIFQFGKKETKYTLRLLPIGGYCAMEGEDGESQEEGSFGSRPVWQRILVVVMGAVMNIVLGLILMFIVVVQQPAFGSTTLAEFAEDSPTQAAGMQLGDQLVKIDGYNINCYQDLSFALATANPDAIDFEVEREGKRLVFENIKMNSEQGEDGKPILRLDFKVARIEKNFGSIITKTFQDTVSTIRMVWFSLVGLLTGRFGFNELAGPVGAASAIGQVASAGLEQGFLQAFNNILYMMMVISVNLGVVNLLPLPALDGGRLIFLIIEGVRRKPINPKYEGWINAAGFVLLMALMVIVTFSDIMRLVTGSGIG